MSFWGELKRRNVFKVGAAYAIVGWLLIQIAATVLDIFEAPARIAQVFTLLIVLGFPVALILAWAFELTPEGIERTADTPEADTVRPATGQKLNYIVIGLLVVAVGYFVVNDFVLDSEPDASAEASTSVLPNSIAVLPLENLSPDSDNAFITDGLHDELIGQLQKIGDLTVISSRAAQRYADDDRPMTEIANELRVQMLMTGSVRFGGNAVRVSAELIDPATEAPVWAEQYNGDLSDVIAMEADIARQITGELRAEILPGELESIESRGTDSDDAYFLYLQAKTAVPEPSPSTDPTLMAQIHERLDQAIALDENFAQAHALKAMHYASSTQGVLLAGDPLTRAERERLTRVHAQRALEIDATAGLAYAALGRMSESFLREAEAEAAYLQAYALTPNDPDLLIDYGGFSARRGNWEDTIRLSARLAELSPGYGHFVQGVYLCWVGECETAARSLETSLRLVPDEFFARLFLGITHVGLGDVDRAIDEIEIADRLANSASYVAPFVLADLAYAFGRLGREQDARRIVDRLQAESTDYAVGNATWALAQLALGQRDQALERLIQAAEDTSPDEGFFTEFLIKWNYFRDPVFEEPEFVAVRDRLGFE